VLGSKARSSASASTKWVNYTLCIADLPVLEAQLYQTREAWLNFVAQRMAPMFEKLRAPLSAQLRIAIGFTQAARCSRSIGECWDNQCSEDRHFEIFIRPDLSESKDLMPMQSRRCWAMSWYTPRSPLPLATATSSRITSECYRSPPP
jgi:hypothetical protein